MPVREIKTRLALDGEKAYKDALAAISREQRVLASEMKATASAFSGNERSVEALTAKNEVLYRQIDQQRVKVDSLSQAVRDAADKYGDGSQQADGYRIHLNNAQAALNSMEGELRKNNNSLQDAQRETEQAADKANKLGDEEKTAERKTRDFSGAMDKARSAAGGMATGLAATARAAASMGAAAAKAAAVGLSAVIVAATMVATGLGKTVTVAADFEAELSNIKSITGATAGEMESLRQAALDAGAQTAYSASEAAQGMDELLKAGLSTAQVLNGGLNGALTLAAAGGIELADAAEIASTVLNSFRADNLSVANAANILAGAANASATSVQELKTGLAQSAAVASGMGFSFQDTATALAVFAQNGLKGSDAGTSLKTMLMNLQPATKEQKQLFRELGLSAKDGTSNFYDAQGSLKSLDEIAGLLQTSLKGLTDAQRAQALETIFGSDAVRAGNILFKEGAGGVNAMAAAMGKVSAADVAAERLNNLKGEVEGLKGSIETIVIKVGSELTPGLKDLTQQLTGAINEGDWAMVGTVVGDGVKFAVDNISKAIPQIIQVASGVAGGLIGSIVTGLPAMTEALVLGLLDAFGQAVDQIPTLVPALLKSVRTLIGGVVVGITDNGPQILAAGIELFTGLIDSILTAAPMLIPTVVGMVTTLANVIIASVPQFALAAIGIITGLLSGLMSNLPTLIPAAVQAVMTIIQGILDALPLVLQAAIQIVVSLAQAIAEQLPTLIPAAYEAVITLVQTLVDNLPMIIDAAVSIILALVDGLISAIPKLIQAAPRIVISLVNGIVQAIPKLIDAAISLVTSLIQYIIENLPLIIESGIEMIGALVAGLVQAIPEIVLAIPKIWKALVDTLMKMDWKKLGGDLISGIAKGITSAAGAIVEAAKKAAQDALNAVKNLLGIHSPSTVMEKQVGVQVDAGIARGIVKNVGVVRGAMRDLRNVMTVGSMNLDMSPAFAGAGAGLSSVGGLSTSNSYTINVSIPGNFTVRSNDDVREIAHGIARETINLGRAKGVFHK